MQTSGNTLQDQRRLEFTGGGLAYLGYALLSAILTYLVIPAAWGFGLFWSWFVRNVSASDGKSAEFQGNVGSIWWLFSLNALVGYLSFLQFAIKDESARPAVMIPILVVVIFLSTAIWLKCLRFLVAGVRLPSGNNPAFTGEYWPMLGWQFLIWVSIYTIVGWAWAVAAAARWYARNVLTASGSHLGFVGKGHEILWRVIVAYLMFIPIVTIPFSIKWLIRWFVSSTVVVRATNPS